MHLGLRLFFGFFLLAGLAALVLLHVVLSEVKPSVREVMEDLLVDSAHVLADLAAPHVAAMPAGGTLEGSGFAAAVSAYAQRPVQARIWGLDKRSLDLRVYVTDARGRVVFDSGPRPELGADYSRWRDVARTLRGEYGARYTPGSGAPADPADATMHVAAPVLGPQGERLGVLAVAKPMANVQQFIDRAERKILLAGMALFVASLVIGLVITAWAVRSVRRLRTYAQQAQQATPTGSPEAAGGLPVPSLPGELGELARAMAQMRERLDNRHAVEQAMRALTHELKSPLTAIQGAAELLHEPLAEADRLRFVAQIGEQAERARELVDRQLELSKLESLRGIDRPAALDLAALARESLLAWQPTFEQRGLDAQVDVPAAAPVHGDAAQLRLALSNLLANAADFAPAGSAVDLAVVRVAPDAPRGTAAPGAGAWHLVLRDRGPGVPDYAWPQLGARFFSTPRPRDGRKGSGLGLAIVRRVAELHGGSLRLEPASPGLRATLVLPAR
ncbi:MAG: two-component system sensor histidine kinase CreC [Rubrivivax sp.]|nr:two-component system sensor histidine kinase CreC [Rubrivivax sp.]